MRPISAVLLLSCFIFLSFGPAIANAQAFRRTLQQSEAGKAILSLKPTLLTEEARIELASGALRPVFDREAEAQQVIDTLIRIKGKNPILLGEAGTGKTEVVRKVAQLIALKQIPAGEVFTEEVSNAEIIQLEATAIKKLGKKIDEAALNLVETVLTLEREIKKPIIIYIDETHQLGAEFWDVLKTTMDAAGGIKIIASTTEREYQINLAPDEALTRRFAPIGVTEFSNSQTFEVIWASWKSVIEERYGVKMTKDLVEKVVRHYKKVLPGVAKPDGPLKVLVDLAIRAHRQNKVKITLEDFFSFVQERTRLPANPQDLEEINQFILDKNQALKNEIIGQDEMISGVLDSFRQLILGGGEKPKVVALMGPTGVGKTMLAETLAEVLYGGKARFFKIDGSNYATKTNGAPTFSDLLGPRPGTVGYKESVGSLVEWMSNPGKGKFGGVLLIDEVEKMAPEALRELAMNLFDNGEVTAGNGKKIRVSNLLIICTTNHAVNHVLPEGYQNWAEFEIRRRIESFSEKDLQSFFLQPTDADSNFKWPKELVKRFSKFIFANPILFETAVKISQNEVEKMQQHYREQNGIEINISPEVVRYLTEQIFNREEGARDLKRAVENLFSDLTKNSTAKKIEVGLHKEGSKNNWSLVLKTKDGEIFVKNHSLKTSSSGIQIEKLNDLKTLQVRVNDEIFGQEELVAKAVNVIRNWAVIPTGKPLSILVVGTTGTGKTELAKVLAEQLFGSKMKAQIVPFGNVGRVEDLSEVFGAKPGLIKSDKIGTFERALMQLTDGGLLVLDELSNAGGRDKNIKEEILFKLYNIKDEGFWISPNTGKRYELDKIIFWMTGNDLQENYYGVSSDDLRVSIYDKIKDENNVRTELRKKGYPEAFLGRVQLVAHTKPLLSSALPKISGRLLDLAFDSLKKQYPGVEVRMDEAVLRTTTEAFFNHDLGGRSLRNKFQSEIQGLISEAIVLSETNPDNAGSRVFEIQIIDNRSQKNYHISGVVDEFKAVVTVKDRKTRKKLAQTTNDLAANLNVTRPDAQELIKTAFHEMGHALLNDPSITGQKVRYITVKAGTSGSDQGYLGYTGYDEVKKRSTGIAELKRSLIRLVAGRISQEVAGYEADRGWRSDYQKMVKLIGNYYVESGLDPKLWGTSFDQENRLIGTPEQIEYFHQLVVKEITDAQEFAKIYLKEKQPLVRFLVARLIKNQSLTGAEFEALTQQFNDRMSLPNTGAKVSCDRLLR